MQGLELITLPEEETCCGFGGVVSVVYPEVSRSMMETKVRNIDAAWVDGGNVLLTAILLCDGLEPRS